LIGEHRGSTDAFLIRNITEAHEHEIEIVGFCGVFEVESPRRLTIREFDHQCIVAKILIGAKISATTFLIFGTKACLKGDIRRRI